MRLMKPYSEYTKDELMRLLESLTPGGSEFHNEPENCVERIRDHVRSVAGQVIARRKAEQQRDALLVACEKMINYRDRVGPISFQLEKADDFIHPMRVAAAAAKEGDG